MKLRWDVAKKATVKTTRYFLWDDEVKGLGVRVMPTGIKSWVLQRRSADGKEVSVTLGRLDELHPDQARRKARELIGELRDGKLPNAPKIKADATFADLYALAKERIKPLVSEGTWRRCYRSSWKVHVLPRWAKLRVADFTEDHLADLKVAMVDKQVAHNRTKQHLAQCLDEAIRKGWIEKNVARGKGLKGFREKPRKRRLTLTEMQRLGAAMSRLAASSEIRWRFAGLICLLLLTGCRLREIMDARWEWVDWEERRINWPVTKTEDDAEGLLPEAALTLLHELRARLPGHPYIIAGIHRDKPLAGYRKLWLELLAEAKIDNLRLHDLRRSFASFAYSAGLSLEVIAELLRHSNPAVTARHYAFLAEDARRRAAGVAADAVVQTLALPGWDTPPAPAA